jgi:hypothetical protein
VRTITYFDEIKYYAKKYGTCQVCKEKAIRQKMFSQTLNPFNKNSDGTIKSKNDIYRELQVEADQFKKEPVRHLKCEKQFDTEKEPNHGKATVYKLGTGNN